MLFLDVELVGPRRKKQLLEGLIDTGTTTGLFVDRAVVKALGGQFLDIPDDRKPYGVDGKFIEGDYALMLLRAPAAKVEVETVVFCPAFETEEILIGCQFLEEAKAFMQVGKLKLTFPRKANPTGFGKGRLRVFYARPVNKFWADK